MQWVLRGSRQQLRSHVIISLGPYVLACQRSLRWRVVMKDRMKSSIECLRLTVRIRYSLYRINLCYTSPFLIDLPHTHTHTHTFFVLCCVVFITACLVWSSTWTCPFSTQSYNTMFYLGVMNKFLVTSNLSDHTENEKAVWCNTITFRTYILKLGMCKTN